MSANHSRKPARRAPLSPIVLAVVLVVGLGLTGWWVLAGGDAGPDGAEQPAPDPTPAATATPTDAAEPTDPAEPTESNGLAFDKTAHSLTDPTSVWVVVNKQHPLEPQTYVPADLRVPDVSL